MTKDQNRQRVARYINLVAGETTKHATVAAHINAVFPDAKAAGPLVSRWRAGLIDISPGNLATFARAYERNPLEAFVVAGMITLHEASAGLDGSAFSMLRAAGVEVGNLSVQGPTLAVAAHDDEEQTIYDEQGHDDYA